MPALRVSKVAVVLRERAVAQNSSGSLPRGQQEEQSVDLEAMEGLEVELF
jgi:hypothetical protein